MYPKKECCHHCPCHCHYWNSLLNLENVDNYGKDWENNSAGAGNVNKSADDRIIKPENDSKEYRAVTLPNMLKAILISDPETDKAAAALSVLAGSMQDPDNIPGLAHFCEHMVFLGTEKYPEENFFGDFLASNAGDYNAFTQRDLTNFYFDVAPGSLEQALDRFAQMFIAPIFDEASAEREVLAINSEHEKNIPSDGERRTLLDNSLSERGHPYSKFDCGNTLTLWTRPREQSLDIMAELRKYFKTRYSANLMNLVVIGKESCDELQKIVEHGFGPIKNQNLEVPSWPGSPYGPDELATRIDLVPVMAITSVLLLFPIPDQTEHYRTGAVNYIGFLLSHGGRNCLASFLKQKRWTTNGLFVSYERPGKGFAFLAVEIDLTGRGLQVIEEVVKSFFQYVEMIRSKGPQKWIWDEIKIMNDIDFRFAEKEEPITVVENLAVAMPNFPARDILVSKYSVIDDYRPELISQLVSLIVPTNMRMIVTSKDNEDIANKEEEWYGTKYKYSKIDHALVQKWKMCGLNPDLQLPSPNPLLPTRFDLKPRDPKSVEDKAPRLLVENFCSQVWFLQDDDYKLPQASIMLVILSTKPTEDARSYNLCELLVRSVLDSITEYSSDVDRAGLTFDLDVALAGFSLVVSGYDCKCSDVFERVLKTLVNFRSGGVRFEDMRDDYLRDLENFSDEEPYIHALAYIYDLVRKDNWCNEALLADMHSQNYTAEDLASFAKNVFAKVKLKWFFHGNFTEKEALDIYKRCSRCFEGINAKPLNSKEWYRIQEGSREAIIPPGTVNIYPKVHLSHWNSATLLLLQCGAGGVREATLLDLMENILCQPAYDVLRTTEQLGYVVLTYTRKARGALSLLVIVQGEKHPSYLDERIENFLAEFSKIIMENLDEDQFRDSVEALSVIKADKPKTLDQYGIKLFDEIVRESYLFNRDELVLKELANISLKDLQDFFNEWISPFSKKRKKLSIQVKSEVGDQDSIEQHSLRTPTSPSVALEKVSKLPPNFEMSPRKTPSEYSHHSKVLESLETPSAFVERILVSSKRGSNFASRRSSGGQYIPTNSRKSSRIPSDANPVKENENLPPVPEAKAEQPSDSGEDLDTFPDEAEGGNYSAKAEAENSSNDEDEGSSSGEEDITGYLDDLDTGYLNIETNIQLPESIPDKDGAKSDTTDPTNLNIQIEVDNHLEATSGSDKHSSQPAPLNKLAPESKSTSTKRRKKKGSKHRQKRKLHKKPSDGLTPGCHFYPQINGRKRKLFESSHQLTMLFKKQALKVKPDNGVSLKRRTPLVLPGGSKKIKETPPRQSPAVGSENTSAALSSSKAEKKSPELPPTGDAQQSSGNSSRSSGSNNNRTSRGSSNGPSSSKRSEPLTDSFFLNYRRKQTPQKQQQLNQPWTSTPKTRTNESQHEERKNWSIPSIEVSEPVQGFTRYSTEDKQEQPNELSENKPKLEKPTGIMGAVSRISQLLTQGSSETPASDSTSLKPAAEPPKGAAATEDGKKSNPVSKIDKLLTQSSLGVGYSAHPAELSEQAENRSTSKSSSGEGEKSIKAATSKIHANMTGSFAALPPQENAENRSGHHSNEGEILPKKSSEGGRSILGAVSKIHTVMTSSFRIPTLDDSTNASDSEPPAPESVARSADSTNPAAEVGKSPETLSAKETLKKPPNETSTNPIMRISRLLTLGSSGVRQDMEKGNLPEGKISAEEERPEFSDSSLPPPKKTESGEVLGPGATSSIGFTKGTPPDEVSNAESSPVNEDVQMSRESSFTNASRTSPRHSNPDDDSSTIFGVPSIHTIVTKSSHKLSFGEHTDSVSEASTDATPSSQNQPRTDELGILTIAPGAEAASIWVPNGGPTTPFPPRPLEDATDESLETFARASKGSMDKKYMPEDNVPTTAYQQVPPVAAETYARSSQRFQQPKTDPKRFSEVIPEPINSHSIPDGRRYSKAAPSKGSAEKSPLSLGSAPEKHPRPRKLSQEGSPRGSGHTNSVASRSTVHTIIPPPEKQSLTRTVSWSPESFEDFDHLSLSSHSNSISRNSQTENQRLADVVKSPPVPSERTKTKSKSAEGAVKERTTKVNKAGASKALAANDKEPLDGDVEELPKFREYPTTSSARNSEQLNVEATAIPEKEKTDRSSKQSGQRPPPPPPGSQNTNLASDARNPERRINVITNLEEWRSTLEYYPLPSSGRILARVEEAEGQSIDCNDCKESEETNGEQIPCHFHYCPNHGLRQVGSCQSNNNNASVEIHVPQRNILCPGQCQRFTSCCQQKPR